MLKHQITLQLRTMVHSTKTIVCHPIQKSIHCNFNYRRRSTVAFYDDCRAVIETLFHFFFQITHAMLLQRHHRLRSPRLPRNLAQPVWTFALRALPLPFPNRKSFEVKFKFSHRPFVNAPRGLRNLSFSLQTRP